MDDPVLRRRSIRKYTAERVSDGHVERLLRAAMAAPSAGNQQPWQFVVIRRRSLLDAVPEVHPYSSMVPMAALAILVCGDRTLERWPQYWEQDCAAATENLLIAAAQLGLGAVWLGVYPLEDRVDGVRALLDLPKQITPFALVPVGWPAEEKPPSDRYDPERVHHDRW
jgi:nitroreductase